MSTNTELRARIARLEDALHYHEVDTTELECVCCLGPYIRVRDDPSDEGRCFACCQTCSMTGGGGKWVRGPQCPAVHAAKGKS